MGEVVFEDVANPILLLLAAFGFLANLLTLNVIVSSQDLRGPFNTLIVSLCVSDIISALVSLLVIIAIYHLGFDYNHVYRVVENVALVPSAVTALHICTFSILRFVACKWPFRKISTLQAKFVAATLWTVVMLLDGVMLSILFISGKNNTPWMMYICMCFWISVTCIITTFTCALIATVFVHRNRRQSLQLSEEVRIRRKKEDKFIVLQLVLIVISFYIAYVPAGIVITRCHAVVDYSCNTIKFQNVSYLFLRVSECLNPVFYNIASRKLRNATNSLLKRWWKLVSFNSCRASAEASGASTRNEDDGNDENEF